MSTTTTEKTNRPEFVLRVSADGWRKLQKAKAEKSAAEREVKMLEHALGISDASALAEQMGLTTSERGETVVHDLTGSPIGMLTVSYVPPQPPKPRDGFWKKNAT